MPQIERTLVTVDVIGVWEGRLTICIRPGSTTSGQISVASTAGT